MDFEFSDKNKKWVFWGTAVLGGFLFFLWVILGPQKLPKEFLDARQAASLVSQNIVDLTHATGQKIKKVDISGANLKDSLQLIKEARDANNEAYNQAFALSRHLQKIAELLPDVKAQNSRELAYQAVSVELGLISELMAYTERMNRFLESLAESAETKSRESIKETNEYLQEINQKITTINKLNKEFMRKIKAFDESF